MPWATLRLPQTDAWGNRYVYSVESNWAEIDTECDPKLRRDEPAPGTCPRPPLPQVIVAQSRLSPGGAPSPAADDLVAIVISNGSNRAGGFDANGQQRALPPNSTDERQNALSLGGGLVNPWWDFRFRSPTPASTPCDDTVAGSGWCEFDDQMIFVPRVLAVGKLLEASRLR